MPILSNALIKTDGNHISLEATDLEIGIQSILPAEIIEKGSIAVKARSLLDIVRELPDKPVTLQKMDNNRLSLTVDKSVFNILALPPEDFPELPNVNIDENKSFVRINGTAIISMLDKTLYAASNDESRYHLNGVYFETIGPETKKYFRMVATDAHRLALVDNAEALFDENAWKLFQEGVIVPRKGLIELRRVLSEGKEDFFMTIKNRTLFLKREGIFISMRLIDGKFADYRRIIPEDFPHQLKFQREEFLSTLKRVSLMSSDKSRSVTFNLLPGMLQISSQSPELGDAQEEIGVDYQGDEFKIGFNSRYLIEALSTLEGDDFILEMKGKQSPGIIRSSKGMNHTNVVMPMRI
jgi:DNA polymerase-3 subunit beta